MIWVGLRPTGYLTATRMMANGGIGFTTMNATYPMATRQDGIPQCRLGMRDTWLQIGKTVGAMSDKPRNGGEPTMRRLRRTTLKEITIIAMLAVPLTGVAIAVVSALQPSD